MALQLRALAAHAYFCSISCTYMVAHNYVTSVPGVPTYLHSHAQPHTQLHSFKIEPHISIHTEKNYYFEHILW